MFLGTMSACPSKYRNVTALYLDLYERGGLLLDCGEDCYGQLQRRCGGGGAAGRGRRFGWACGRAGGRGGVGGKAVVSGGSGATTQGAEHCRW